MHLYLVRHGQALSTSEAGVSSDEERPLSSQGRQALQDKITRLSPLIKNLDACLVSPYRRAQETAQIILSGLEDELVPETFAGLTPESSLNFLLEELLQRKSLSHIMLVGHEPYMGLLLGFLLTGKKGCSIPFATGGIAHVEIFSVPLEGLPPRFHWFENS